MGGKINHNLLEESVMITSKQTIEERACLIARYIIDSKDTVRGAARIGQVFPESIAIKGVFLSVRNPVVKLGLVIK